jgi:hypothetical protein
MFRCAVVVEVGDGRAPRIIMRIDADLFEVSACLVRCPDVVHDVLVHEVLDSDFASAGDVEADLTVPVPVRVGDRTAAVAAERPTIELRLHTVVGQ